MTGWSAAGGGGVVVLPMTPRSVAMASVMAAESLIVCTKPKMRSSPPVKTGTTAGRPLPAAGRGGAVKGVSAERAEPSPVSAAWAASVQAGAKARTAGSHEPRT